MHYCQHCQQQVAASNSLLCIPCFERFYATVISPQVRALMPAVAARCHSTDPRGILQARRTFVTALEKIPVESNYPPSAPGISQEQMVQQATTLWTAYFKVVKQYTVQVSQKSPAWEFRILFTLAYQQRARYRRLLWTHWRFDVEQRAWRSGYFPIIAEERAACLIALSHYVNHESLFYSGGLTVLTALQADVPLIEALREAAQTMRTNELESITQDFIGLMSIPLPSVQDWVTAQCAGWVRAQIRVFGKEGTSLRNAFHEHQISPTRFRKFLFDSVSQAHQAGHNTPQTILTTVRRQVGALRNTGRPRGRPRAAATRMQDAALARTAPYALDALAQQQARHEAQRTLAAATEHARLGPQEKRVWEMWDEEGLSYKEIAAREGSAVGSVGSALSRARKKLHLA